MDNQEKQLTKFEKWDDVMKHKEGDKRIEVFTDSEVVDIALSYHQEQMEKDKRDILIEYDKWLDDVGQVNIDMVDKYLESLKSNKE